MVDKRELRQIELRLVAELMKNSRRSDRDLAKALKISQPTISRMRKKLEKEGIIKEYTVIPDFGRLGYTIMAIVLALSKPLEKEEVEKARKIFSGQERRSDFERIMLERGIGSGYDAVDITLHKDLASFNEYLRWLRRMDFLEIEGIQFLLVDLKEKSKYLPLTFSEVAKKIEQQIERESMRVQVK